MDQALAETFDQCQRNASAHQKGIRDLWKLYLKSPTKFRQTILPFVNLILPVPKKEPAVERIIRFLVKFATHFYDLPDAAEKKKAKQFVEFLLRYLLENDDVVSKSVRARVCFIIALLLNEINKRDQHNRQTAPKDGEDEEHGGPDDSATLWSLQKEVEEKMFVRVEDKVSQVRLEACKVLLAILKRHVLLGTDHDDDEAVLEKLLTSLEADPAKEVRKLVLTNLPALESTRQYIFHRAKDIEEEIRVAAFGYIEKNFKFSELDRIECVTLISDGLKDKEESVKKASVALIMRWIEESEEGYEGFLKVMEVDSTEELMEEAMGWVFAEASIDHHKLQLGTGSDSLDMSNEKAFLLRTYCEFVQHKADAENRGWHAMQVFDEVLPELSRLCLLLKDAFDNDRQFVLRQLLRLCYLADFSDEAGRRTLQSFLCQYILPHTSNTDVRKRSMVVLRKMNPDQTSYIEICAQLINELFVEFDPDIDKDDEAKERETWVRCLSIAEEMLFNSTIRSKSEAVMGLHAQIITPAIRHTLPEIRLLGVRCLGLLVLHDFKLAKSYVPLLMAILGNDTDPIRLHTIKILFDLLLIFRPGRLGDVRFAPPKQIPVEGEEKSTEQNAEEVKEGEEEQAPLAIVDTLLEYLSYEATDLRTAAGEGMCKLFYADILSDPQILTRLCLELFHPYSKQYSKLHRSLRGFFRLYASSNQQHKLTLEKASSLTFKQILKAPANSSTAKIDCKLVANFVLELTDSAKFPPPEGEKFDTEIDRVHNRLAVEFLQEVALNPLGRQAKVYPELIQSYLSIDATDQEEIMKLRVLVEKALKFVKEVTGLKILKALKEKFQQMNPAKMRAQDKDEILKYESQRDSILSGHGDDEPAPNQRALIRALQDEEEKAGDTEVMEVDVPSPTTAPPRKTKRTPSALSAAAKKEHEDYFAKKQAEFADLDDFDLPSQADPPPRGKPKSLARVKTPSAQEIDFAGYADDDNDGYDAGIGVGEAQPDETKAKPSRVSFSPNARTKELQAKLTEKQKARKEMHCKLAQLEAITAVTENPEIQALLASLKNDIRKLDDGEVPSTPPVESLVIPAKPKAAETPKSRAGPKGSSTTKAKASKSTKPKEKIKPVRATSQSSLFLAGAQKPSTTTTTKFTTTTTTSTTHYPPSSEAKKPSVPKIDVIADTEEKEKEEDSTAKGGELDFAKSSQERKSQRKEIKANGTGTKPMAVSRVNSIASAKDLDDTDGDEEVEPTQIRTPSPKKPSAKAKLASPTSSSKARKALVEELEEEAKETGAADEMQVDEPRTPGDPSAKGKPAKSTKKTVAKKQAEGPKKDVDEMDVEPTAEAPTPTTRRGTRRRTNSQPDEPKTTEGQAPAPQHAPMAPEEEQTTRRGTRRRSGSPTPAPAEEKAPVVEEKVSEAPQSPQEPTTRRGTRKRAGSQSQAPVEEKTSEPAVEEKAPEEPLTTRRGPRRRTRSQTPEKQQIPSVEPTTAEAAPEIVVTPTKEPKTSQGQAKSRRGAPSPASTSPPPTPTPGSTRSSRSRANSTEKAPEIVVTPPPKPAKKASSPKTPEPAEETVEENEPKRITPPRSTRGAKAKAAGSPTKSPPPPVIEEPKASAPEPKRTTRSSKAKATGNSQKKESPTKPSVDEDAMDVEVQPKTPARNSGASAAETVTTPKPEPMPVVKSLLSVPLLTKKRKRAVQTPEDSDADEPEVAAPNAKRRRASTGDAVPKRRDKKFTSLLRPNAVARSASSVNSDEDNGSEAGSEAGEERGGLVGLSVNSSFAATPAIPRTPRRMMLSFTGFADSDKKYNVDYKNRLAAQAEELGLTVIKGDKSDSAITHVIAPPNVRTFKTLVAVLGGRWLLRPEWIEASTDNGAVVPEKEYGIRNHQTPFLDKKVFVAQGFKENKTYNPDHLKFLVERMGKGKIIPSGFGADMVLVGSANEFEATATTQVLTWPQFFEIIQPTH